MRLTHVLRYAAARDKATLLTADRATDSRFVTLRTEAHRQWSREELEAIRNTLTEVLEDWPEESQP